MSKVLTIGIALVCASGAVVAQQSWDYAAFGDSLATGYLAQAGYVARYDGFIQADNGVAATLYNLGQNGWTSGSLLAAFRTNAAFQIAVSQANVVTWDIGINDFRNARNSYKAGRCGGKDNQNCLRAAVSTFITNWDGIVAEVLNRRSIATTIVRTMDLYDPWVAADAAANTTLDTSESAPAKGNDFQVLEYYLDAMNSHIALSAASSAFPFAAVHTSFNGPSGDQDPVAKGYIGSDGLHPSEAGHEVIAELLRALGYASLR